MPFSTTPQVYCIGEALLDIIFQHNRPEFATPGGSMLNSAVSLGRAGVPVHLISDFADDRPGDFIDDFLKLNHVGTEYINRYAAGKTALALAFLDDSKDAAYTFYKDYPAERFPWQLPEPGNGDIILFGSIYSITEGLHDEIIRFINKARRNGAFILYDPNFRKPHLHDLERARPLIMENIRHADLVRGSDEDFNLVFGAGNFDQAWRSVSECNCQNLVYTKNKDDVEAIINGTRYTLPVPEIIPVSTIGAGDAFNAGLIYGITLSGSPTLSGSILQTAVSFSSNVCLHLENYISEDFATELPKSNI